MAFFPLDVLDEIWDLIVSVSEGFLTYSYLDGFVRTKIFDKRDDFGFDIIVNFAFLDGDVSRSTSYGVYISQLIRIA